ncbi:MAG: pectin acetylesterase-family hydrolase, partial [Myxococcota bacterium]
MPAESTKSFEELVQTSWEELTQADRDRLALLTGEMTLNEYNAIYHPDLQAVVFPSFDWGRWETVQIPGAVCGNGSPYKVFVMRATDNRYENNLAIYMEPGGACWDYESCTGQNGVRGAANPDGVPDNYMSFLDMINPFRRGGSPMAMISPLIMKNNPTGDNVETSLWNKVFIPYCTGDVHSGDSVVVYEDPTGRNEPLTFHHAGASNVERVIEYLRQEFFKPSQMMVMGCSAGGTGSLANYHFFRQGLEPDSSYLLNDSGPIFPAPGTGHQFPLQQHINATWNLSSLTDRLEQDGLGSRIADDFGQISELLARHYPEDPIAITLFKRDRTYSGYSYARFWDLDEDDPADRERILDMWADDVANMKAQYEGESNLHYYIPYMRKIMDSHCTTIIDWTGTEIADTGIEVGHFIDDLIDD